VRAGPRRALRVVLLTREYPPHVYGGAGVHVEHLAAALARLCEVEVRCFGDQDASAPGLRVRGFRAPDAVAGGGPALEALAVSTAMARDLEGAALVHTHTWYAALGGFLARFHGLPHVLTTHSLEPLRPWKEEQLGAAGYGLSSWLERTAIEAADAVIAVSGPARQDVLRVYPAVPPGRVHAIPNGVDAEAWRRPPDDESRAVLARHGVPADVPYALFVGRLTPQKGALHFLEAARRLDPRAHVVLLAGAPDTPEHGERVDRAVERLRAARAPGGVHYLKAWVPRDEVRAFYARAAVYGCPSVYEPFGIVNLEAMACEAPVVATRTGGIPDAVEDGETGFLVDLDPAHPERFEAGLAERMNALLADPDLRARMGGAGRRRVEAHFTWRAVAERTHALYRRLSSSGGKRV